MTFRIRFLAYFLLPLFSIPSLAQQTATPTNSPQAVTVLTNSITATGSAQVQSFTATGTITFFQGGKQIQAPATIKAQGAGQFRIDATLQNGTWTLAINNGSGVRVDPTGHRTTIPLHNMLSGGLTSFPYMALLAGLSDPTLAISYIALVPSGNSQLNQVRTNKNLTAAQDPGGTVAKLSQTDYFIDSQTNLVVKIVDTTHPVETFSQSYPHEMDLQSYATFNGVAVPTVVRELINGQTGWEFDLSAITFNTSLTNADFTP